MKVKLLGLTSKKYFEKQVEICAAAATAAGINTCVMRGDDPEYIYKLLNGEQVGTMFIAEEGKI